MMYDYIIVGSGLFGAVVANRLKESGKQVLVIEKRSHIGGNIYTEKINNIHVHKYGAHIFHTNNKEVWNFVNNFVEFNRYTNSPVANYNGELFSLPFNMYTFNKMWGVNTPKEAQEIIEKQKKENDISNPSNLEEQAISLVGKDIYEQLIKGYTEKQWGRNCKDLPDFIIKRLPVRFTFDNNYFNADYQGIPKEGYTKLIEKLLEGVRVDTSVDFLKNKEKYMSMGQKIIYTGAIDEYYDYIFGCVVYRNVRFETEVLTDIDNYQGNAVVNYTDRDTPWTRIIEHKWFTFGKDETGQNINGTIISKEYSCEWKKGMEAYYPINDLKNAEIYSKYKKKAESETKIIFGGRLAEYKYYDMDKVVENALALSSKLIDNYNG